ncbi:uncharacterized protein LOC135838714 isoform X3 [Planococcus citri]|uniref:uncharacterized protein LOC135838714 isoform X3 n=1 Tax=Planococcus citri TaxID=170843 RepID=UPI0031F799CE
MPAAPNQTYLTHAFDQSCGLGGTNSMYSPDILQTPDMDASPISADSMHISDLLGLRTPRGTSLVNPSRQLAPSIMNLTGDQRFSTNVENSVLESSIMSISDKPDRKGYVHERCGHSPKTSDNRSSSRLTLDISRARNPMFNRNNGSPPFSDSSASTGSSGFEIGFFPHNIQTCRSDSPISEASSNNSAESISNHMVSNSPCRCNNVGCDVTKVKLNLLNLQNNSEASSHSTDSGVMNLHFASPTADQQDGSCAWPLTEQGIANVQNLHVIRCMSGMTNAQLMQTYEFISRILQTNDALEMEARCHRTAAGHAEAQFTWCGTLPNRSYMGPYSSKVFLGGLPWDITEEMLICSFRQFGNVKVEWPGKEQAIAQPKGYAYIIFENEMQVKLLLESCREGIDENEGSFYYKIPSRRSRPKEVQVIPWSINDSNYSVKIFQKLEPQKTVFVGALHGMMNAEGLFRVMDDLFGGVLYAGIDTDKNKYPIGSARVTFNNDQSYAKAVGAAFVDIKTSKFTKKVQIDPYLEDSPCSLCSIQVGPYFCRENGCFRYFCTKCWKLHHHSSTRTHKPLMRNSSKHAALTNSIAVSSH